MKPTSIIFLILAAILIVSGIVLCIIGGVMADSQGIELLSDSVDNEGNALTDHSLEDYSLTDIDINVKDMDVRIKGQSVESKIEFKNINYATYDFRIYNKKLTIESINPFDIFSIVKFRENDSGFNGLRHYLHINKYDDDVSEVCIYLKPGETIDDIKINVENGNIIVENMICDAAYDLKANNGNVTFKESRSIDTVNINVKNGNFSYNRSSARDVKFDVENGTGEFICDRQFNFYFECESGDVFVDDNKVGDINHIVFPENVSEEDAEATVPTVGGKIKSGDLIIDKAE